MKLHHAALLLGAVAVAGVVMISVPMPSSHASQAAPASIVRSPAVGITYDLYYDKPTMHVIVRHVPYLPLLRTQIRIHVVHMPRDFHLEMLVFKWPGMGPEARQYGGVSLKNIRNLPIPSASALWTFDRNCSPGRYYTKWITTGISSTGRYQKIVEYWPWNPTKPAAKYPPDRRHSFLVKSC
jgi:hypothetical protein